MKSHPKFVFNRDNLIRTNSLNIPNSGISDFVRDLSKKHNISLTFTKLDEFAFVATRLAGDTPSTDETRGLLIALTRAKKNHSRTDAENIINTPKRA